MGFWQNTMSIFIGALSGFIFSICLFYFTQKWSKDSEKKSLEKNLISEFTYNDVYLKKLSQSLTRGIEKVGADNKNMHRYFGYTGFQTLFLNSYFTEGHLYKKLLPEDINRLEPIIKHMSVSTEGYINPLVKDWKEGKTCSQPVLLDMLTYQRDTIETFIKDLDNIKQKIK